MKIVIFGASGKTGSLLLEQALDEGHEVIAYVRRAGSIIRQHPRLKVIAGSLSDTGSLKDAIVGADACISTLGGNSLTKHAPEIIQGINNIILQMEQSGVMRFIYLSSLGAGASRFYMGPVVRFLLGDILLRVPLADHNMNENRIAVSQLNWTVVRPGGLTNGPKTGKMKHGSEKITLKGSSSISRANVASFMLSQLLDETTFGKFVWLLETV
jgi:putative NADH-flavin reductase